MIKFENGIGQIEGRVPLILHETKEILRSVRKMLEENMSKEDADEWIDKIVRRSAMTEKEELLDSFKGMLDGFEELKKKLASDDSSDSCKEQEEEPTQDLFGMLLDALLSDDGKDQED